MYSTIKDYRKCSKPYKRHELVAYGKAHGGNRRRAHRCKDSAEMPTRTERRRPRADPGAFNCSGRGLPGSEVLRQVMLGNMKNRFNEVRTAAKAGMSS